MDISDDLSTTVRASVIQHLNGVVLMTDHDNRLICHRSREIVPRVRNLACMANINPGVPEQVLNFQIENGFTRVQVPVDFALPDQIKHRTRIVKIGHAVTS